MKVRSYPGKAVEAMGLSYEANWEGLRNPFRQEPMSVGSTVASSFEYHPSSEARPQSSSISSRDLALNPFRGKSVSFEDEREEEFSIPRPKLIVPVHTYGIRKRRTGMVLQSGRSGSGDGETRHKQNHHNHLSSSAYQQHPSNPNNRQQHRSCPDWFGNVAPAAHELQDLFGSTVQDCLFLADEKGPTGMAFPFTFGQLGYRE
ncbi:hypothetical protein GE061_011715 [Apolygus lucorum]|uniref:Uncharacterized protein n=1 Tax=Apolygus lucorum TaxID=248454 RepID=A0A8S9Y0X5_APOLU|nr:hypothetical protein GE061_011715 [Apolygus lucorum]